MGLRALKRLGRVTGKVWSRCTNVFVTADIAQDVVELFPGLSLQIRWPLLARGIKAACFVTVSSTFTVALRKENGNIVPPKTIALCN